MENENEKQQEAAQETSPYDWGNLFNPGNMQIQDFNCFI